MEDMGEGKAKEQREKRLDQSINEVCWIEDYGQKRERFQRETPVHRFGSGRVLQVPCQRGCSICVQDVLPHGFHIKGILTEWVINCASVRDIGWPSSSRIAYHRSGCIIRPLRTRQFEVITHVKDKDESDVILDTWFQCLACPFYSWTGANASSCCGNSPPSKQRAFFSWTTAP